MFFNRLPQEAISGFVNFSLSLPKFDGYYVLRPQGVFKLEIALNARFALVVGDFRFQISD